MTIALILKIRLGFDSKYQKFDNAVEKNHFGSLSVKLFTLKQSALFGKLAKIGQ